MKIKCFGILLTLSCGILSVIALKNVSIQKVYASSYVDCIPLFMHRCFTTQTNMHHKKIVVSFDGDSPTDDKPNGGGNQI